ncbi:MAG: glycosyltransferase family 2 protein [Chloroflexota bacterium]
MPTITAVILTKDEANHIVHCIESLSGWVDSIVVFDSYSHDDTCLLARQAGAMIIQHPWENFASQRQAALNAIESEWILFIDADERATVEFAYEVRKLVDNDQVRSGIVPLAGYWLPRRNFIIGKELRHGGYYPDYQLRLLRRGHARYDPRRQVHETVLLDGNSAFISQPILHYNYDSWKQFHQKQRFYAEYEAQILAARGIRPRPHNFVLQPLREFRRRYISLMGWKDGWRGLQLAVLYAWYYGIVPYWILTKERKVTP